MVRKQIITTRLISVILFFMFSVLTFGQDTENNGANEPADKSPDVRPVSQEELNEIVKKLASDFLYDRETAKKKLLALGNAGKEAAKIALLSENFRSRISAIEILSNSVTKEDIATIINSLLDKEFSVSCAAKSALVNIGIPAIEQLENEIKAADKQRKEVLSSIINVIYEELVKFIITEFSRTKASHGHFPGQYEKITSLGKIVTPALIKIALEGESNIRQHAIRALGELGDKNAINALKEIVAKSAPRNPNQIDSDAIVAACILYKLGEKETLTEIINKSSLSRSRQATLYAYAGAYDKAEELMKLDMASTEPQAGDHFNLACMLAMQNKNEEAVWEIQISLKKGFLDVEWYKLDREIDNIRKEPKFKELMKQYFPETDLSELTKDENDKEKKEEEKESTPEDNPPEDNKKDNNQ
ncbi:MAG: hypothetical protein ABIH42_03015 [Planctomycetota bacterium]